MKKQKKSHFIVSITKFTKAKLSFKILSQHMACMLRYYSLKTLLELA